MQPSHFCVHKRQATTRKTRVQGFLAWNMHDCILMQGECPLCCGVDVQNVLTA